MEYPENIHVEHELELSRVQVFNRSDSSSHAGVGEDLRPRESFSTDRK